MTVPFQYSIGLEKITLNLFLGWLQSVGPSWNEFNWNELKPNCNRYFAIGWGSIKPLALKDIQSTTVYPRYNE